MPDRAFEPGARQPILAVRGLAKAITLHILAGKRVEPLRDVSFDLAPGEFLGVIGPSGAGKSSLLKCLYRTYLASAGTAAYAAADGGIVDLLHADERTLLRLRRHEIHYVSQFLKAPPRVPAVEVVASTMLRRGADPEVALERARITLERLGVGAELQSSYPALFSGGEQQRVNVARALVDPPRLLLLDEPTSALDADNRARVLALLSEARTAGTAMIGVFHDHELLTRLSDRVLVIEDGVAARIGTVDEVDVPAYIAAAAPELEIAR